MCVCEEILNHPYDHDHDDENNESDRKHNIGKDANPRFSLLYSLSLVFSILYYVHVYVLCIIQSIKLYLFLFVSLRIQSNPIDLHIHEMKTQ